MILRNIFLHQNPAVST